MQFERVLLSNLVLNEAFGRKVIPFIKSEYFQDRAERALFELINEYMLKYSKFPTKEALAIDLSKLDNLNEDVFSKGKEIIEELAVDKDTDSEWLLNTAEQFCKDKAIYIGIMTSIKILDDKTGKATKGMIPKLLSDALGVSFDSNVGHDFLENVIERYEYYHLKEHKIPFDLDYFNRITKGGVSRKTLNIILAGTGVGKSMFMCHAAAANLTSGHNVLYITLEMAEEKISERIDANLLNINVDDIVTLSKEDYLAKLARVKSKTAGKLIVKEYPTSCAGSANFRHLLEELKVKKNFRPDIIYIDYINICASSRIKNGTNVNSYTYIKAIAEELRGLAVEYDVPIISATQTNREGFTSSDVGMENVAESFGLPATADFMFALTATEELDSLNQLLVKQLKNRYSDTGTNRRFVIGMDRAKMKLYDCEQNAQTDLVDDRPVMDKTAFGQADFERKLPPQKFNRENFIGFK